MFCCCIPKGMVHLNVLFNAAAYQGGETAQVKATIRNESTSNIDHMVVRLVRNITVADQQMTHRRSFSDVVASAVYAGVPAMQTQARDLPLALKNSSGEFIPSMKSKRVEVRYVFTVECDVPCAPDSE